MHAELVESQDEKYSVGLPRIGLAGSAEGVGVSTIMLGLLVELKQRGLTLAAGRLGSSLVEPTHYRRITGHLSHTIDPWILEERARLDAFARLTTGAELVIVEGERGLYDCRSQEYGGGCAADVFRSLGIPVVLVVDARRSTESLAAATLGFINYDRRVKVCGVIANRVQDEAQNQRIKAAIENLHSVAYLGGIPEKLLPEDTTRLNNPSLITRGQLLMYRDLVSSAIDINGLVKISRTAEPLEVPKSIVSAERLQCRIAVADDAAFHLCFQDNLDLLRRAGAELKAFSPLADSTIPSRCHAIYFPSGYVSLYHRELSANFDMIQSIRNFVARGGIVYAEGDASAYLSREFGILGQSPVPGVNILPAVGTAVADSAEHLESNYCVVKAMEPNFFMPLGSVVRGIRDGRWAIRLEEQVSNSLFIYDCSVFSQNGNSEEALPLLGGMSPSPNVLISLAMTHWGSHPAIAERFVSAVKEYASTLKDPA